MTEIDLVIEEKTEYGFSCENGYRVEFIRDERDPASTMHITRGGRIIKSAFIPEKETALELATVLNRFRHMLGVNASVKG